MSQYLIGLDVGTSMTKAALFDRSGREIAVVSNRTRTLSPRPGWYELDADELWDATAASCRQLLAKAGVAPGEIAGLAITAVMIGGWLIDAAGQAVRPGILWNDGRAQALVDEIRAENPRLMSQLFDSSGQVMQLGCTLPVLAWLVRHEPETVAGAVSLLTAKDYIRLRLTGAMATDESDAAIAPGSARGRCFNPGLLDLFGLASFARLLPEVLPSEALAGTIAPEAAAATGLLAGTPVAVGAGDLPASVVGAGAALPGLACTVLGTTCLNGVVADAPLFRPRDMGILFTVPGNVWIKTLVNVAGTTNLDWCLKALCPDFGTHSRAYEALTALAETSPAGANGATYVPYLSHIGIIGPRLEAGARAAFTGLHPDHDRADLVRAVYEGVAYAIADCYARIDQPIDAIRLVGGGARSRFWAQMIADIAGRPVEVPAGTEFGAKGAALLAGTAIGWYGSVREACTETFALDRRHEPQPALAEAYDAAFARYRTISEATLDGIAPTYR